MATCSGPASPSVCPHHVLPTWTVSPISWVQNATICRALCISLQLKGQALVRGEEEEKAFPKGQLQAQGREGKAQGSVSQVMGSREARAQGAWTSTCKVGTGPVSAIALSSRRAGRPSVEEGTCPRGDDLAARHTRELGSPAACLQGPARPLRGCRALGSLLQSSEQNKGRANPSLLACCKDHSR